MKDIDMELLEDLIAKCEAKMASPFKKAKAEVKKEEEPVATMVVEKEEAEPSHEDEADIQDLIELYKKLKD